MLGKIEFETARHRHEAWLNDDLTWDSDDPAISRVLNEISDPSGPDPCLSDDAVRHLLYRMAYRIGGRVARHDDTTAAH